MNKLYNATFIFALTAFFVTMNAQDVSTSLRTVTDDPKSVKKKLNARVYGGASMDFLYEGEYSEMKGGRFGMSAGLELNKNFGKVAYGILGAGITSGGYERWINDDPLIQSKVAFDQVTAVELPLGVGFNLGKEVPKGFFLNLLWINSITIKSESNYTIVPFGTLEASNNVIDNTFDIYNMGAKAEFGIKTKFEGNSYASFSLAPRVMFYNRFSTNSYQYTGLSVAALMSFYF